MITTRSMILFSLLGLLWSGPASAKNIYRYSKGGRVWFSTECPKKTRCQLVLRGDPVTSAAVKPGEKKRTTPRWKPPVTKKPTKETKSPPSMVKAPSHPKEIDEIIVHASKTYNIPETFVRAVITIESAYKVKALSHVGAMGLMQLMPGTVRSRLSS